MSGGEKYTTKDTKNTRDLVLADFVLFVPFVVQSTAHHSSEVSP